MDSVEIERLLEKYFEAETSLVEEALLSNYFAGEEVAPHLMTYKALFGSFSAAKLAQSNAVYKPVSNKRAWLSIAVSVTLLTLVYTGYQQAQERKAESIYKDTRQALDMLAVNLHKGSRAISRLQTFETTQTRIVEKIRPDSSKKKNMRD